MPEEEVTGPLDILHAEDGSEIPFYVLPFDRNGECTGPQTRAHLFDYVANNNPTDVFVFSHGWNNDWGTSISKYRKFISEFRELKRNHNSGFPDDFRPVLVGIFWPSTALVMPWEKGPDILGGDPSDDVLLQSSIDELSGAIDPQFKSEFSVLIRSTDMLDMEKSKRLAEIIASGLSDQDDAGEFPGGFSADDLLASWRAAPELSGPDTGGEGDGDDDDDFGVVGTDQGTVSAAGFLDFLDPRQVVRMATVLLMKDRAGKVGANGVSPLVTQLLDDSTARLRLIGHSYGAKVLLSAVAANPVSRQVESILLLEPAISHLCFAVDVKDGRPGGYRSVLDLVRLPIFSTFSKNDFPLHHVFHLAARRRSDLGEAAIAGGPPSKYAALGGYGPYGCAEGESTHIVLKAAGSPYNVAAMNERVVGLDGAVGINGHGDTENTYVYWALLSQILEG